MKNLIFKRISAMVLSLIFTFSTVVSAADPIIEKTFEEKKEVVAQAGAALEQRINKIEDAETFAETDKYVFDVVKEAEEKEAEEKAEATEKTEEKTEVTESTEEKENTETTEEPKVEATEKTEEPEVEETEKTEEPKVEETEKTEEPKVEETEKTEEPKVEETEKTEEPEVENTEEKTEVKTEEKTEAPKEEATTDKEEEIKKYDWENLSDKAFEKWVLNEANSEAIKKFVLEENEEYKAFEERLNLIEDAELYQKLKQYIYDIKATEFDEKEQDKFAFPWTDMTDEEFAAWVTSGEHDSYIVRILSKGEDATTEEAFIARIRDMQDEKLLNRIYDYLVKIGFEDVAVKPEEEKENTENTENTESTDENQEEATEEENVEGEEEVTEELLMEEPKTTYVWDAYEDQEFAEWVYDESNLTTIFAILSETPYDEIDDSDLLLERKNSFLNRIENITSDFVKKYINSYINNRDLELDKKSLITTNQSVTIEYVDESKFPKKAELQVEAVPIEQLNDIEVGADEEIVCGYDVSLWRGSEEYFPTKKVRVFFNDITLPGKIKTVKNIYNHKETGEKMTADLTSSGEVRPYVDSDNLQRFVIVRKVYPEDQKVTVEFNINLPEGFKGDQVTLGDMSSFEYVLGEDKVPVPCHYYIEGYGFLNWNTQPDGTGTYFNDYFETVDPNLVNTTVTLFAQWDKNIYFDYGANRVDSPIASGTRNIRINKYDYRGFVFEYREDENGKLISYKVREIAGRHFGGNNYYVYKNREIPYELRKAYIESGRFVRANGKVEYVLPKYDTVKVKDGDNEIAWGDYITNHPAKVSESDAESDLGHEILAAKFHESGEGRTPYGNIFIGYYYSLIKRPDASDKSYKIEDIIESDYEFFADSTKLKEAGNVGNVNIVIDNLWSAWHRDGKTSDSRTAGPLLIEFTQEENKGNEVNLYLVGDNTLGNLGYSTVGKGKGNKLIIKEYVEGSGATLTLGNTKSDTDMDNNWMDAALGSREGFSCDGLEIHSGTIYAGTTPGDEATAIGAGAGSGGYANIKIFGGTVTAVANSGGAAIGGGPGYNITNIFEGGLFKRKNVDYSNAGDADILIGKDAKVYAYNGGASKLNGVDVAPADEEINDYEKIDGVSIGGGSAPYNNGGSANITIEDGATVVAGSIGGGKTYKPDEFKGGNTVINYEPTTVNAQFFVPENAENVEIKVPDEVVFDGTPLINTDYIYIEPNGGAINLGAGTLALTNATIRDYTVSGLGGGIYVKDGTAILPDIQLLNNKAGYGGAIAVDANERTEKIDVTIGYDAEKPGNILEALNYSHISCPQLSGNTATEEGGAIYYNANENSSFKIYCLNEENNTADGEFAYNESDFIKTTGKDGTLLIDPKHNESIVSNGTSYFGGGNVTINGTVEGLITVDIDGKEGSSFTDLRDATGYARIKLVDNYTPGRPYYIKGNANRYKTLLHPIGQPYQFTKDIYTIPRAEILGWHNERTTESEEEELTYKLGTYTPTAEGEVVAYAIWKTAINYVWDGTTDKEFADWVYDEKNSQDIIDVLAGKTPEKVVVVQGADISAKDSLDERVESIANSFVKEAVKSHISLLGVEREEMSLRNHELGVLVEGDLPVGTELKVKRIPHDEFTEYATDDLIIDRAYNITLWVNDVQYHPTEPVTVHLNDVRLPDKIIKVKNIYLDKSTGEKNVIEVNHSGKARLSFKSTTLQDFILLRKQYDPSQKVTVNFDINLPEGFVESFPADYQWEKYSGLMQPIEYVLGEDRIAIPCHFFLNGYGFVNWNTASDGSGTYFNDYFETVDTKFVEQKTVTLYAQWNKMIYFDINSNTVNSPIRDGGTGIRVNSKDYRGYVWEFRLEGDQVIEAKVREIAGKHYPENNYYVYYTGQEQERTDIIRYGRFVHDDGRVEYRLPEYIPVKVKDGDKEIAWGDYITNHPKKVDEKLIKNQLGLLDVIEKFHKSAHWEYKSTNGSNRVNGAAHGNFIVGTSVTRPIPDPANPGFDTKGKTYDISKIIESDYAFSSDADGNVKNVNIIFDNIWVSWHHASKDSRTRNTSPLHIDFTKSGVINNTVNLKLIGDNRMGNINYSTNGQKTGNQFIIDNYDDEKEATLTISDAYTDAEHDNNWMDAPLGSKAGYSCDGLVINGGNIYVATHSNEMTTAIGAGAGPTGYANITINGGKVTAISNSGGAAIGGGIGYRPENKLEGNTFIEKVTHYDDAGGADININGGEVYAYNGGRTDGFGVSIGGGSALYDNGGFANITIKKSAKVVAGSIGGGRTRKPEECNGGKTVINCESDIVNAQFYVPENSPKSVITVPDGVTFDGSELINTDLIYAEPNGGAIYLGDGSVSLTNATIQNYKVSGYGGGIYVKDGTINLPDIQLLNNKAGYGGAIAIDANERTENANITIGYDKDHNANLLDVLNYTHSRCPLISGNTATEEGGAIYFNANDKTTFNVYCLTENSNKAEGKFANHESDFLKTSGTGGSFVLDPKALISIAGSSYVDGANVTIKGTVENTIINDYITVDIDGKSGSGFEDNRQIKDSGYTKIKLVDNYNGERPENVKGSPTRYKTKILPVPGEYLFTRNLYSIPGSAIMGWHEASTKSSVEEFDHDNGSTYETHKPNDEDDYLTAYAIWAEMEYKVIYDPNVPEGATLTAGTMEDRIFAYDTEYVLDKNAYDVYSYHFAGWNTKPDGSGVSYTDEQTVKNLTDGQELRLYAQWEQYIYFDLAASNDRGTKVDGKFSNFPTLYEQANTAGSEKAKNISITETSYQGYIFSTTTDENGNKYTVQKKVSGTHKPGNKYYVYVSNKYNYNTTGEVNGKMILPKYDRATYDGQPWGDFITNHPAGITDGYNNSGSNSVKAVIDAWDSLKRSHSQYGSIWIEGNVGEMELVLDNVYSRQQVTTQNNKYPTESTAQSKPRNSAGVYVDLNDASVTGNRVYLKLKGDSRLGAVHYATYTQYGTTYGPDVEDTNNRLIIDELEKGNGATLTLCDIDKNSGANFWAAALGSDTTNDQCAGIVINGGTIYAGTTAEDDTTAIGGGGNGAGMIEINGGRVTAVSSTSGSAIGGGIGKKVQGGSADVTINGGDVYAYNFSCSSTLTINGHDVTFSDELAYIPAAAIGGGSSSRSAGNKSTVVKITGGNVYAQSVGGTAIGGGSSTNTNGGPATVNITGGNIIAKSIPGKISGVEVPHGAAIGGGMGGIYGNGGNATVNISGNPILQTGSIGGGGTAKPNGTVGFAKVTMSGGTVTGQFVMAQGAKEPCTFDMTGGQIINSNTNNPEFPYVRPNGGAVYMNDPNGKVTLKNATIKDCTAENGGAIYMVGGSLTMSDSLISGNKAINGDGGAFFASAENDDVTVDVLNGSIIDNETSGRGGAIAVVGSKESTSKIDVVIGVNENHSTMPFDHTYKAIKYNHASCPVIQNNLAKTEGGALFLAGSNDTNLKIYCVDEKNNKVNNGQSEHNFIKIDGGNCIISSSQTDANGNILKDTSGYGNVKLEGTTFLDGGNLSLFGSMDNPQTKDYFTVDIKNDENGNPIGSFTDNRPVDDFATKIHYHENFFGSGKYKAIDIPRGETVTISGNMYNRPGYSIVGWNTEPDGTGTDYPINSIYDPETYVQEDGKPKYLIIYAMWEKTNYHIDFDANVPDGESYQGTMEGKNDLEYDEAFVLPSNKFVRIGYVFTGWNTKPDGSGTAIADGATVSKLTTVNGETVTLYAQWRGHGEEPDTPVDPENPEQPVPPEQQLHRHSYSVEGTTLIRTCTCGIVDRATLSAYDTVYNGNVQNTVKVAYTSNIEAITWRPVVTYDDESPIDAGPYTASVSEGGETATVSFTIHKAEQAAPPTPTYTESRTASTTTIKVNEIPDNGIGQRLYRVVYYVGNQIQATPWSTKTNIVVYEVLKNYYIEAKYGETLNYNESPATPSKSGYYAGEVRIEVLADEGISYTVSHEGNKVDIAYTIDSGYYKTKAFKGTATVEGGANLPVNDNGSVLSVTNIPNAGVVLVTITGVKKLASAIAKVAEGEIFASFVNDNNAQISRDSAFTAQFEIKDYVAEDYDAIKLVFGSEIPAKSTIILMDKNSAYPSYWYCELTTSKTELSLTEFTKMGATEKFTGLTNGTYQFVVNFEETSKGCTVNSISMSLEADAKNGQSEGFNASVNVGLSNVSHSMAIKSTSGLKATLDLKFNKTATASKWDNRRNALVLRPKQSHSIPNDAKIRVTKGTGDNQTTIVAIRTNGLFIVPLEYLTSDVVTVELVSDMFPEYETKYIFSCEWLVSHTSLGTSLLNGAQIDTKNITLTKAVTTAPSIKLVSAQGGKRIFSTGEIIELKAEFDNIGADDTVKATMMYKNENGVYDNYGITKNVKADGQIEMTLGDRIGSYCILLEVVNSRGYTIAKTPYYFVIVK